VSPAAFTIEHRSVPPQYECSGMGSPNRIGPQLPPGARPLIVAVWAGLVLAAPIVFVGCGGGSNADAPTTTSRRPPARRLPPNAIRIVWKQKDLRPAAHSGQVCIVTVKTGRVCASYRVGQIPATALKIKLLENGFIPVTVKPRSP
jgi:hypothetical protein